MTTKPRRAVPVVLAAAVVVVLGGLLVARLTVLAGPPAEAAATPVPLHPGPVPQAPPAIVPAPAALPDAPLELPCWSCPEVRVGPICFRTDLDLLAPLGTGPANAAVWFKDFVKNRGSRWPEAEAASKRRTDHPKVGKVLVADDPLLREAEPWVDQSTMRFYPDILPVEGLSTRIPNLMLMLTFARSWVARGMDTADEAAAMADFRRAVRLGRLLRQEDVTIIADLVGLACIRIGTEAIYERAARDGNEHLALAAAIAAGEAAPQRLLTAARVTGVDVTPYLATTPRAKPGLNLPDSRLDTVIAGAKAGPDRRMRGEPMIGLAIVRRLGSPGQRERATRTLEELSRSEDGIIAASARYLLAWDPTAEELQNLVGPDSSAPHG